MFFLRFRVPSNVKLFVIVESVYSSVCHKTNDVILREHRRQDSPLGQCKPDRRPDRNRRRQASSFLRSSSSIHLSSRHFISLQIGLSFSFFGAGMVSSAAIAVAISSPSICKYFSAAILIQF